MSEASVIECRAVGKVFRRKRRAPGALGLARSFLRPTVDETVALAGVTLAVRPGERVGLIGINGAGKTTLVKCLTGIVPVSSGQALLFGRDSFHLKDAEKRRLALVMGQRSQLWWDIPPLESFRLLQEIYEVPDAVFRRRVAEHAERLDVADRLDVQLRQLSLGERMKMEIIGAFLHDPEVVFLDEPTIGLDLVSQEAIRQFLRELARDRGAALVLTSHDMVDIEEVCQRLLILDAGQLLHDGDLAALQRRLGGKRAVEIHLEPGQPRPEGADRAALEALDAVLVRDSGLHLVFETTPERVRPLVQHLIARWPVHDLAVERQPLERLIREIFRTRTVGCG